MKDDLIGLAFFVILGGIMFFSFGYSSGVDSVDENEIIMLMIQDPAPAIEIMKTGKWPELSEEGFVPGAGMSAEAFITFQGAI